MRQTIFRTKWIVAFVLTIFLSVAWTGCSTSVKERQEGQPVTGEAKTGGQLTGKYYFDDVRVPSELNYKPNDSFVYETPKFKAGVMRFSRWRVDVDSLIDFFTYNMEKDNWKLANSFKGKESFFNFSKPDKTCLVKIYDNWIGTTTVEIRVGPLGEKM
jgi:hypothetical protein